MGRRRAQGRQSLQRLHRGAGSRQRQIEMVVPEHAARHHDYDSLEMPVLVDAPWKGRPRKLLLQANRNGFYYISRPHRRRVPPGHPVRQTRGLAEGLGRQGPPHSRSGARSVSEGDHTCPSTAGATNWPSPTYDPKLHLFYFVAQEGCGINIRDTARNYAGTGYLESPDEGKSWQLFTRALDAFTGKKVWDYEQVTSHHYGPGLMSTAVVLVSSVFRRSSARLSGLNDQHHRRWTSVPARNGGRSDLFMSHTFLPVKASRARG